MTKETSGVRIYPILEQVNPFLYCTTLQIQPSRCVSWHKSRVQLRFEVSGEESWWSYFNTSGKAVNARRSLPVTRAGNTSFEEVLRLVVDLTFI